MRKRRERRERREKREKERREEREEKREKRERNGPCIQEVVRRRGEGGRKEEGTDEKEVVVCIPH